MLWAGVGSRVGSTAWRMHAFHPALLARTLRRTCATIATLRRPSSVEAAILRGALLRSCLAGRAMRGPPRDTSALATPASIVILAIELPRIVTGSNAVALMMSRAPRHCQRPLLHQIAQFARTGALALLYRSMYRIEEPRQQPNEDSQRGPRRPPPIPYRAPHHRTCGFARPQSFIVAKNI